MHPWLICVLILHYLRSQSNLNDDQLIFAEPWTDYVSILYIVVNLCVVYFSLLTLLITNFCEILTVQIE